MGITIGEAYRTKPCQEKAVGIDFGTTYCVVSFYDGKEQHPDGPQILKNQDHPQGLIPSFVTYDADNRVYVGQWMCPTKTIRSVKRILSTLEESAENFSAMFRATVDLFCYLRHYIVSCLGKDLSSAVITVPAYFHELQRHNIKRAAEVAGFKVLRLLSEPTAAAIFYGVSHDANGVYGVYDWGGGTFDFSLLKLSQGILKVYATGGDPFLGGDDVDLCIAHHIASAPWESLGLMEQELLIQEGKKIKEHLSETSSSVVSSSGVSVSYDHLMTWVAPLLEKTIAIACHAIKDAELSVEDLTSVLLVGGTTRLPMVPEALRKIFPAVSTSMHPDYAVALGSALYAYNITQEASFLLLDVTPLSLGVETWGGLVDHLIPRNSPLPAEASHVFTTAKAGQTSMKIHVVQGEGELVSQCRSLGLFDLSGIPPLPKGAARIHIRFVVDSDGLLMVYAQESTTGVSQSLTVNSFRSLSDKYITEDLHHPDHLSGDDVLQRMLIQKKQQALDIMEELHRLKNGYASLFSSEECKLMEALAHDLEGTLQEAEKVSISASPSIQNISQKMDEVIKKSKEFVERVLTFLLREHLTPDKKE